MKSFLFPSQLKRIKSKKKVLGSQRKKKLDTLAIDAIKIDSRAFGDFHKPGIRGFFQSIIPNYSPPQKATVSHQVKKIYFERRDHFVNTIKNLKYIAMTTYMWKSNARTHL
jgi:hypothetical protein